MKSNQVEPGTGKFQMKIQLFLKSNLKRSHFIYLASLIVMLTVYFCSESDEFVSDIPHKNETNDANKTEESLRPKKAKIFCIIHTYPGRFKSFLPATFHTWVKKCDNYRYISALKPNDLSVFGADKVKQGANEIVYLNRFPILQPTGWTEESTQNLTEKTYFTFMEIYKKFPNFDWYLRAGKLFERSSTQNVNVVEYSCLLTFFFV